jgi:hypothetical protein
LSWLIGAPQTGSDSAARGGEKAERDGRPGKEPLAPGATPLGLYRGFWASPSIRDREAETGVTINMLRIIAGGAFGKRDEGWFTFRETTSPSLQRWRLVESALS